MSTAMMPDPGSPGPAADGPPDHRARNRGMAGLLVVVLVGAVVFVAGIAIKQPCRGNGWMDGRTQWIAGCYSDIPQLYEARGLSVGEVPYFVEVPSQGRQLEYPVLTGAVMWAAAAVIDKTQDRVEQRTEYFDITAVMMFVCAVVALVATYLTGRGGPKAALMVALSPALLLDATINWDLLPVAAVALGIWAWTRDQHAWAGVALGVGAAAKLYPAFLLGPILIICLREKAWRTMALTFATAAGAWLVVNLPVMVFAFDGWKEFYVFSRERGIDFGSPYLAGALLGWFDWPTDLANTLATGSFVALCVGIGALGLFARRTPTLAQLAFLVIAAFAITNKVYSPQYVLWLVPLAALARPRWPAFLVWQLGEVAYFFAVWRYILGFDGPTDGAMSQEWYAWIVWLHIVLTTGYAALVVADILRGRRGGDAPIRPPDPVPVSAAAVPA